MRQSDARNAGGLECDNKSRSVIVARDAQLLRLLLYMAASSTPDKDFTPYTIPTHPAKPGTNVEL